MKKEHATNIKHYKDGKNIMNIFDIMNKLDDQMTNFLEGTNLHQLT